MKRESSERPSGLVPSIKLSLALFGMVVLFITIAAVVLVVSGVQSTRLGLCMELLVQWGFMFLPIVLILRARQYDVRESLSLRIPGRGPLVGVLLIAPSVCVLLHQMLSWQTSLLPMPEELGALVDEVRSYAQTTTGSLVIFAVVALSAPICEEVLFRGILLSSLQRRLKSTGSIVVTALLFSVYHLHPWRMSLILPLGVVLAYVVLRSGSLYLSILFHSIHNTLSLALILRLNERYLPAIRYSEEQGFSGGVVVASVLAFVVGVAILEVYARRQARARA